ncbi:MAG TPA: AI-2E family transporter [Acetobacteraceae bacterium]|nr:AI-2E family transporter [Acetobacteraceae bacterium]
MSGSRTGLVQPGPREQGPHGVGPVPAPASTARDPVRTIAHILRATVIVVGLCALLWVLASAFVTIILAVLFAVLLRGLARALHNYTHLNMTASVLAVFIALVLVVCGLGYWIGPRFATEGQQLWNQVSGGLGNLSDMFGEHTGVGGASGGAGAVAKIATATGSNSGMVTGLLKTVATSTIGLLAAILVIVATGVYLALSPDVYVNGVAHLTPVWYQQRTRQVMNEMALAMQGWMLGQLIDMAVVFVVVLIGLWLVGTPLFFVLAIVAGVCTFVPYFGTIISAIPAIIVALTVGVMEVVWVVAVFVMAHVIEGYVTAPFVQRRTVHLPPALTLLSFVVMVAVFNIFGVLIATPLVACIMVGVARVYVEDILGDPAGAKLKVHARWYWFTPPDETEQQGQRG